MLTVFSDLHCPWSYVFSIRLRRALSGSGVEVSWRCWPLELVNDRPSSWEGLTLEIAVVAQLEPEHFSAPRRGSWPTTLLPAMEAVKVAGALGGPGAEDCFDELARRALFLDRRDLSMRTTLLDLAAEAGLDKAKFRDAFDAGARGAVVADWEDGSRRGVQGSPQVFLPDGSSVFHPGVASVEWQRGIPVPVGVDEGAVEALVARAGAAAP